MLLADLGTLADLQIWAHLKTSAPPSSAAWYDGVDDRHYRAKRRRPDSVEERPAAPPERKMSDAEDVEEKKARHSWEHPAIELDNGKVLHLKYYWLVGSVVRLNRRKMYRWALKHGLRRRAYGFRRFGGYRRRYYGYRRRYGGYRRRFGGYRRGFRR